MAQQTLEEAAERNKLDLNKIEEKLNTSLENETTESLTNWLKEKRDKNNNMAQIEPIEISGFKNKGVFLKMYGQHPFSENKTLKAEITDIFGNVLFTRILVYGTTEEVAQQLGLTLINEQ